MMQNLTIKVCGMREKENILELSSVHPDFVGLIFYDKSKRYAGLTDPKNIVIPNGIKKVGVFINSTNEEILKIIEQYALDLIQLHGDETPDQCKSLQKAGIKIIKAFSVDENFDFKKLDSYESFVDYFLFDTKGKEYGGNGITFNWEVLSHYKLNIPFFLSGGIDLQHVEKIKNLKHTQFFALDLNSRFELEPGLKDVNKIKYFIENLRN